MVDLGAGTGALAIPLALRGLEVWAVEPARRMLDALERRAAELGIPRASGAPQTGEAHVAERGMPRDGGGAAPQAEGARAAAHRAPAPPTGPAAAPLHLIHAAAGSTGLPAASFDLAVIADALHWLDPERAGAELSRLLAPSGAVAIVEVDLLSTPFLDALWPRLSALNQKARPRALDLRGPRRQLLALAAPGAEERSETFEAEEALAPEAAAAVVASLSFVGPALSPAAVESLTGWAEALAKTTGASWRRRLHLRWARRK